MERLHGLDSLDVVYRRFSDGVEVVRCVLEFCKVIGDVEQSYSNSMHKMMRSSSYTLHSNIIMQWLGGDPFQEIGTLKHCWQKLGSELYKLADLHSEKATAYLETVRRPLMELIPQLEETRKQLKVKMQMLRANLEVAEKKYTREKQKYFQLGDSYGRLKERVAQGNMSVDSNPNKLEARLSSQRRDLELQECVYKEAHTSFSLAQDNCNAEISELYKMIQEKELERVKTVKISLQEFAKTLSNTAPAYLESMQQIVISVDEVDGSRDIDHFVKDHQDLLEPPALPEFALHQSREGDEGSYTASMGLSPGSSPNHQTLEYSHENGSLHNGERTPSPLAKRDKQERVSFDRERGADQEEDRASGAKKDKTSWYPNDPPSLTPQSLSYQGNPDGLRKGSEEVKVHERKPRPSTKPSLPRRKPRPHNENTTRGASSSSIAPSSSSISASSSSYTSTMITSTASGSTTSSFSSSSRETSGVQRVETTRPQTTRSGTNVAGRSRALNPSTKSNVVVRRKDQSDKPPTNGSPDLDSLLQPRPQPTFATPAGIQPQSQAAASSSSSSTLPRTTRSSRHTKPTTSAHQPTATNSLNPAAASNMDPREYQLLSELRQCAASSDYYSLFEVGSEASFEDIAKARREKSREFHPDHYGNDPERRAKAEEKLRLINQVFQDVMKTKEKRALYDQLCRFRMMYPKIVLQPTKGLEAAQGKLATLQRAMKKARLPLELQDEIQLALNLIQTRLDNLSRES